MQEQSPHFSKLPQLDQGLASRVDGHLKTYLKDQGLTIEESYLRSFYIPLAQWIHERAANRTGLYITGISGGQGAGKTTTRYILELILSQGLGMKVAGLSIDDLYHTRATRHKLASSIHPLFATRGVPGSHDVRLGLALLQKLAAGEQVRLPSFDKARDDRRPIQDWPTIGQVDVLIFEGWCLGASAQTDMELIPPINELEANEDSEGVWRRTVNDHLKGEYRELFAKIDDLIFLAVPNMDQVVRWRTKQEQQLKSGAGVMDEPAIGRFVQHFERISRHMLKTLPSRTQLCCYLNETQRVTRVACN